ncbi:hypothetical protein LPB137_08250 [Poseidonibacter parvus]|uniref:histidine kinase n=1 Tax=Poseidonibacter parvus TaxID=1850254 RepID=A0A1P8KMU4_9BACT|nr:PAS domain S-box protein [Poseidonibacter parvus]APW65848.1 hypothetical protein LPB137_08250 [Poseidonibacter parvus]
MKTKHDIQQLHNFIELISDLAFVKNFKGQFTHINEAFVELVGKKREDIYLKTDFDLFPKEEALKFKKVDDEIFKSKKSNNSIEEQLIHYNGTISYFNTSKQVLYDLEENEIGLFCVAKNITIRKEYEIIYRDNQLLLEYIAMQNKLKPILDKIVLLAEQRNINSMCSILLLDKEKKHLLNCSAPSLPIFYTNAINGVEIGEKVGSCGSAAFKKKRVIVENINTHENWKDYLELTNKANLHSCWSQPIISSNNEVLGTFAIYNTTPKAPSSFELKLISAYSNLAAIAIEKDNNYRTILENEYQLSLLFNNTHSGLIYVNEKNEIQKANQRFIDIFGYETVEEIKGLNDTSFYLPNITYENIKEKLNGEYQFKKKDGTSIWCEFSGKLLNKEISSDLSKGVLWTINDISSRKVIEEELKQSEYFNKNILETIPNMLWLKDMNGFYITCNRQFEKFYNIKKEKIIGKTDYDFEKKEIAKELRNFDKLTIKSSSTLTKEQWLTSFDNKRILSEITKRAITDKEGNIIGVLGISHDITKRYEAFEKVENLNKLAESLTKFQSSLLSLFDKGDAILFKWKNNKNYDAEYISSSVKKLLGYEKEEFLSKKLNYGNFIHKDDYDVALKELKGAIENKLDYFKHEPYRIVDKDNNIKWILDYTVFEKDSKNNITHFIGYITDITEQLKQQEIIFEQSKLVSMGEMIGNIAHQWRQPLSVISTISTACKLEKELDILEEDDFINKMEVINTNAQYLSQTIDDFRDFIKADRELNDFILSNAIKSFLNLANTNIVNHDINIVLDLDDDIILKNYQNDMIQAFINIINNSIDAFENTSNKEKFFFIKTSKINNKTIIKLKDNAGGIDINLLDKVFEPYTTNKHKSQGTGLGLNITYNFIVIGMKGEISVENLTYSYKGENYKGCEFTITL